ncbi:hypothetical protein TRM7615_03953 [Falsiruegeria mediterranea M17]|uniref:Uncharacterized protein n=1 Tax=Falsiruegeria mediterranea M17 TaxID=1200281 RepID=A0A2R8CD83_9RHOB|nr:hypothetical protein TRM7615_03953 [Falsiruegeria mediterranea M17]
MMLATKKRTNIADVNTQQMSPQTSAALPRSPLPSPHGE